MPQLEHARSRTIKTKTASPGTETLFPIELPALKDAASIQRAISLVVQALAGGVLDAGRARTILYGLQIASVNTRHLASGNESLPQSAAAEPAEAEPAEAETATKHKEIAEEHEVPKEAAAPLTYGLNLVEVNTAEADNDEAPSTEPYNENTEPCRDSADAVQYAEDSSSPSLPAAPHIVPIPSSCFAPGNGYRGNARDRLLARWQKAPTVDKTPDLS